MSEFDKAVWEQERTELDEQVRLMEEKVRVYSVYVDEETAAGWRKRVADLKEKVVAHHDARRAGA